MEVIESLDGKHIGEEIILENGIVTFKDGEKMQVVMMRNEGEVLFLSNSNYQIRVRITNE